MTPAERDRRLEELLRWTAAEARRGLDEALAIARAAPVPSEAQQDPAPLQAVETRTRDLRTTGGGQAPPLREGWVVAAGQQALPAEEDGLAEDSGPAEDDGPPAAEGAPWTS